MPDSSMPAVAMETATTSAMQPIHVRAMLPTMGMMMGFATRSIPARFVIADRMVVPYCATKFVAVFALQLYCNVWSFFLG
jgi:hypothetical protein